MGKRARVLFVDDDEVLGKLYRLLLGGRYEVAVARSGAEALACLSADPDFDAVICDLTMPGIDGQGVYEALRACAPAMCERLLFTTGGAASERLRRFVTHLDRPLVAKPFRTEDLVRAVEHVLDSSTATRS